MNYTNPGAVSHNEILQMYKDYIDPDFTWSNFTVEEQAKVIVAPRSNNLLDTKRVRLAASARPGHRCCLAHLGMQWWLVWLCGLLELTWCMANLEVYTQGIALCGGGRQYPPVCGARTKSHAVLYAALSASIAPAELSAYAADREGVSPDPVHP